MDQKTQTARHFVALPAHFGPYEVREILGKGGMGSVYVAVDTRLDRLVALKVPGLDGDAATSGRFLREIRAAAGLYHPNLCPVFDVGVIEGLLYFTMPRIEGVPLSKRLDGGQRLGVAEAVRIVRDVALAMYEAHQRGIVHRDLKPANIMLTRQGQPVVMDFGLARCLLATDNVRLTVTGTVLGTPAYMSPEQAGGLSQEAGPASDIYSLGAILYEMLTGRTPFQAPAVGRLIAQIERDAPPALRHWRPELPSSLEAACLKALAKRPAERFGTMTEFAAALLPYGPAAPRASDQAETVSYANASLVPSADWSRSINENEHRREVFDRRRLFYGLGVLLSAGSIWLIYVYWSLEPWFGALCLFVSALFFVIGFAFRKSAGDDRPTG